MALPYAAAHESVFALEAQVMVGLAPVPLTAELQPQGAAVTAVFQGIDPTFIAGILLTHISRLGCIYSSQTPARCLGAKAALSLGGPADGVPVSGGRLHVVAVTVRRGPFLPRLTAGLHQLLGRHFCFSLCSLALVVVECLRLLLGLISILPHPDWSSAGGTELHLGICTRLHRCLFLFLMTDRA